jgi:signal transduction histidine kinase
MNVVLLLGFGWLSNYPNLHAWISAIVLAAIPISIGIAMTKHRLYDIDVVISRTFVYASLAVFITAVYVGIVVGASLLFGAQDDPNIWLGVAATVVIAIAFQPLRRWLQKVANRLVYGRRASPYEVLSSFSQRVAAIDPDVLGQIARSLAEGTTATSATIWTRRGDRYAPIASWPEDQPPAGRVDAQGKVHGADHSAQVTHDDEQLGIISLTLPPGLPFLPTDERLLEQVTAGLGLALRNLQLTDDLKSRVVELRESRRRIVAVQDQTRQGLERDLHDGAQQRLVALKIKVGIGVSMSEKEGLDDVKQILDNVKDETDLTIDSLRTLARGIYPPLLDAEGLGPALTTQLHRMAFPVTVQAAGIGRHPRELEATVYFCVLEAVQNSIKHAQANSVLVTLSDEEDSLIFEVRDDGVGFDIDRQTGGHGLVNITDRLDAVEGSLQIDSRPGHGTLIKGRLPVFEGALT